MAEYQPAIGLEIHAELATRTKMFCRCKNDPDEKRPNWNICPVCLAHPGTLPVINKEAVRQVLRVGLALQGQLALDFSEFDRKNYFYPDIPKGYQISQYKYPLVSGGELGGVKITRVHLEEDTATSKHLPAEAGEQGDYSLVDYNRAGVPLMELVTEPVITSAKQAADFARELQLLLRYLGTSEANMEKGEMRVEANISVAPVKQEKFSPLSQTAERTVLGVKVEVKNLNSFRAVEHAIKYELKRQREALEAGERVAQETRGWDDARGITFSQRQKESSHDYRYFPEPDLPKLCLSAVEEFKPENLRRTLPELPWIKRERYKQEYGIKSEDIEVFVADLELDQFFEGTVVDLKSDRKLVQLAANYITSDIVGQRKLDPTLPLPPHRPFAELIKMISASEVSSRGAKDILAIMLRGGELAEGGPRGIAEVSGLFQKSDESHLGAVVEKIIAANPKSVSDYRAGRRAALQYLIGQGMKESKGSANPAILEKLLQAKLG